MRFLLLLLLSAKVNAYTVIIPSTSAPAGTEQALIAQTTTYFNAKLIVNPLVKNTYQINLLGPAISDFQILRDSGTYSFVWGEGVEYQRDLDVNNILGFNRLCDQSPYCVGKTTMTVSGDFTLGNSTYTVKIDSATCQAIACQIAADIWEQQFDPPIAPAPPSPP